MSYSSCSCFVCLTGPYKCVYIDLEQLKFGTLSTILSYWPLDVKHGNSWLTEVLTITIVAPHKDGLGYKKFGYSLEVTYNTVGRVIQRFSKMGFTQNKPRKGQSKKLSPCAVRQVQKLALKKRTHECCQHCFRWLQKWKVSLSVVRPYATHCNKSLCMAVIPEGSLFWSWLTKKACKQFAENNLAKSINCWNAVLWSDESKVNLFDLDGVQHVWRRPGEEYQWMKGSNITTVITVMNPADGTNM